jgi:pyruvate formate lyase activating enzyme
VDFKHADTCKHQELTGAGNELIKANLRMLSRENAAIEIRIPLIPGCNNDRENLLQTGEFLSTLRITKVQLLPYHHYATAKYAALGMKYMMPEEVEAPENDELQEAVALLAAFGLNAVV